VSGEFGDITFREKPDISQVFIRQLDRTNQSAMISPEIHQACINQILANLPITWRRWVYEQEDTFRLVESTLMYKKFGGRRLGSRNAPLLKNPNIPVDRYEDGSIDWSDPNIVSPTLEELPRIDYQKFNELVMDAAQLAGLTWQIDPLEVDAGDTIEYIDERKKTPFRMPRVEEDESDS